MAGEQTKETAFPSDSAPPFALPDGKSLAKEDILRVAMSFVCAPRNRTLEEHDE